MTRIISENSSPVLKALYTNNSVSSSIPYSSYYQSYQPQFRKDIALLRLINEGHGPKQF